LATTTFPYKDILQPKKTKKLRTKDKQPNDLRDRQTDKQNKNEQKYKWKYYQTNKLTLDQMVK